MEEPFERLQRARLAAGYREATDAARAFGWNENTYRSHENGQRGLRKDVAERYGRALKVSPAWLLTGEGAGPGFPASRDYNRDISELRLLKPDLAELIDREIDFTLNRPAPEEGHPRRK